MSKDIVIIGTGGQARECLHIVDAMIQDGAKLNFVGFADDAPSEENSARVEALGYSVLGTISELSAEPRGAAFVIGIGNGSIRARIDKQLQRARIPSATLAHPTSSRGRDVQLGDGCVLWAGSRLTTNVCLGRHVHVNQNSTIGHDSLISDYATINPMAAVSGNVSLGDAAMVGAGAVVLQGLRVGSQATVGAGGVVVRDVPSGAIVKGVPAK